MNTYESNRVEDICDVYSEREIVRALLRKLSAQGMEGSPLADSLRSRLRDLLAQEGA